MLLYPSKPVPQWVCNGFTSRVDKLHRTLKVEEKSSQRISSRFKRSLRQETTANLSTISNERILTNRAEFSKSFLSLGYVQSFIDFYNLTHMTNYGKYHSKKLGKNYEPLDNNEFTVVEEINDMYVLKERLIQAEVSRREGSTKGVFAAYKDLAGVFVKRCDWRSAIFFYEKFLEISQLVMDVRAEMLANHELGCVYYHMEDLDNSMRYHQRHEELAYSVDLLEEVAKANAELHRVHVFRANVFEKSGDFDSALRTYQLSLDAARKCWDRTAEAEANGNIGGILLLQGRAEESLPFLVQQSNIAVDMGLAEGRCKASSALAYAYDLLNNSEKAIAELTLVHSISAQDGDTMLQAKASKELGILYSKLGRLQDAADSLNKHFQLLNAISKSSDTSHLDADIETARCLVGISKGNLLFGSYILTVQGNIKQLLNWKLTRNVLC